ncbi:MAG TPA: O-methyltransferase [Caulobacteraceae bacterium]|jgi:predicted O-methyltransferase YrrM|nr:O-methyltransferase [Caulobacteraceae bacterium]
MERFGEIDGYIDRLFAPDDPALAFALAEARAEGLPAIQISAGQGKLLYLLAKLAGARRILEIGTLGGYSTIWLGRALPPSGFLVTLELEPAHARVAAKSLHRAGLLERVELMVGPALSSLETLAGRGVDSFDLVFLDADKVNYSNYFRSIMPLVRPGSLILADNVIRGGAVTDPATDDPSAIGARDFNALIAADDRLEAIVVQQVGVKGHDGLAIARVK